jgi:uncharacterized OB-fold protein
MADQIQTKKKISFDKDKLELLPDGGFNLLGLKCIDCGTVMLGRHPACMNCHSRNTQGVNLSSSGKLHNYSVVHLQPSSEWKGPVPYALCEVILDEGPAVITYIADKEPKDILVGMSLRLSVTKIDQDEKGNEVMIYVWKAA